MNIERYETAKSTDAAPLGIVAPIINQVTAHCGIVYVSGVTAHPARLGDVKQQTTEVLIRIDALLAKAGTSKANLLAAQVWLTDMSLFTAPTKRGTPGSIPRMRRSAPFCCHPVCGTRGYS